MSHKLYELDVRLKEIEPPIWRTIEVAGSASLEDVHFAIQIAMGWQNSHLHQFNIGKKHYGMAGDETDHIELEDERAHTLESLVDKGQSFTYEYDFGDGWEHAIKVNNVTIQAKEPRPRCTAGARACPPEDCGGPGGYARLIEVLGDRNNPEHAELAEWAGDIKPERFKLPKKGLELRDAIEELRDLANEGVEPFAGFDFDDDDDDLAANLPKPLVEAVFALDPMQRASLAALIAGSLADEVLEAQHALGQLVTAMKSPAPSRGRSKRS